MVYLVTIPLLLNTRTASAQSMSTGNTVNKGPIIIPSPGLSMLITLRKSPKYTQLIYKTKRTVKILVRVSKNLLTYPQQDILKLLINS